jgi:hypothetical protein
MSRPEIYFSTDIEADGPIPGPNSMLSLGCVAILRDGTKLGSFSINLETLPGAAPNPKTMEEFWDKQPEAWAACRKDPVPPEEAIRRFVAWIEETRARHNGRPVLAAYPVLYDGLWVHWYLMRFAGRSPFSHSGLDMKTLAMALLRRPYRDSTKRNMPKHWFGPVAHNHVAVDDARGQAHMLAAMFAALEAAP